MSELPNFFLPFDNNEFKPGCPENHLYEPKTCSARKIVMKALQWHAVLNHYWGTKNHSKYGHLRNHGIKRGVRIRRTVVNDVIILFIVSY